MDTLPSFRRLDRFVLILVLILLVWAPGAGAQTRDAGIAGPAPHATLSSVASAEARRLFTQTATVERRTNDSVLNGAIIGAAAGVAGGLLLCRAMEPWEVCNDPGPLLRVGALGAGIGIGIDALIRKREIVSVPGGAARLTVAPVAGRRAKGIQVAVRF